MEIAKSFFGEILIALITTLISAYPAMLLWNSLIPELLGLTTINYEETVSLILLCGLLTNRL